MSGKTYEVIDLAADIAHARAVIAQDIHAPIVGLINITPLGLALFEVLVHVALHFHEMGCSLLVQ